jgi:hypothetical protein
MNGDYLPGGGAGALGPGKLPWVGARCRAARAAAFACGGMFGLLSICCFCCSTETGVATVALLSFDLHPVSTGSISPMHAANNVDRFLNRYIFRFLPLALRYHNVNFQERLFHELPKALMGQRGAS